MTPYQFNKKLRLLAFASLFAASVAAQAQTSYDGRWDVSATQKATAAVAAQNGIHVSELLPDAPSTYVVKKGDTLWGVSAYFLKDPWNWPALWGMNQQELQNPHRIYPGQILHLIKNGERVVLKIGRPVGGKDTSSGTSSTVRLSPTVRSIPLQEEAIPVLPPEAVIPFLENGTIIPRNEFENSPRIVALPERKLMSSVSDKVYVRGGLVDPEEQTIYLVYTTPKPVRDPITKDILGFQANYLGKVEFMRAGQPADPNDDKSTEIPSTFRIIDFKQEIRVGDHLTPASTKQELLTDYVPTAAPAGMEGHVVDLYGENVYRHASLYQIILLNKGHLDGLERGNVVALWRAGTDIKDKTLNDQVEHQKGWDKRSYRQKSVITTPDERYGMAMVFKTFDHLSYAIIMQVSDSVEPGDKFTTP